jgi:hypothetical protein
MAVIRDVRLIALDYALPEIQAYGMARALTGRRQAGLLEVETADGVVGLGEAWGPPEVTAAHLELLRNYYVGRELYDHQLIWHAVLGRHYHLGIQNQLVTCMGGLNVAIWDALGRTLGVPLCKLLGGRARDRIPVYAWGGDITRDPDHQLAEALTLSPHYRGRGRAGSRDCARRAPVPDCGTPPGSRRSAGQLCIGRARAGASANSNQHLALARQRSRAQPTVSAGPPHRLASTGQSSP